MARIHEILGIEPGETAVFQGSEPMEKRNIRINEVGKVEFQALYTGEWYVINVSTLCYIIDHPESIIRKPRLTEKQKTELKHLAGLGLKYLTTDWSGWLHARDVKPTKTSCCWADLSGYAFAQRFLTHKSRSGALADLVSYDDSEPLDIIQTLKDNNVEV